MSVCDSQPCWTNETCAVENDGYVCQCSPGSEHPGCTTVTAGSPYLTYGLIIGGGLLLLLIIILIICCYCQRKAATAAVVVESKPLAKKTEEKQLANDGQLTGDQSITGQQGGAVKDEEQKIPVKSQVSDMPEAAPLTGPGQQMDVDRGIVGPETPSSDMFAGGGMEFAGDDRVMDDFASREIDSMLGGSKLSLGKSSEMPREPIPGEPIPGEPIPGEIPSALGKFNEMLVDSLDIRQPGKDIVSMDRKKTFGAGYDEVFIRDESHQDHREDGGRTIDTSGILKSITTCSRNASKTGRTNFKQISTKSCMVTKNVVMDKETYD